MINVTRETVTRVFQKLQKNGVLKRNGDILIIHNLNYINHVANGSEE